MGTSLRSILTSLLLSLFFLANAYGDIEKPQRTQGLAVQPQNGDDKDLVTLQGKGVFVAAHITKQGGTNDITFVSLDIDGRNVVNTTFAAVENLGFTQSNPFGLVILVTDTLKTLTIGFPDELKFKNSLKLSVSVQEAGIAQILANVIHGK